jgi:prophage DNA circulation protein
MPFEKPQWAQQLQPASFNSTPFFVDQTQYMTGRRVAVHSYPFRDNPYVEDLGLQTRQIGFRAFLVGADVYSQRDALKKACETKGNGKLVHPSLGNIEAALVAAGFREDKEHGGAVELNLTFLITDDKPRWPTANTDTQGAVFNATGDVAIASKGDFFDQVGATIQQGTQEVRQALNSANQFINTALAPLRDAAGIFHSVAGITGIMGSFGGVSLGRYIGNPLSSFSSVINAPLSTISRGLGAVNCLNNGVSALTSNLANLRYDTTRAFTAINSLGSLL